MMIKSSSFQHQNSVTSQKLNDSFLSLWDIALCWWNQTHIFYFLIKKCSITVVNQCILVSGVQHGKLYMFITYEVIP